MPITQNSKGHGKAVQAQRVNHVERSVTYFDAAQINSDPIQLAFSKFSNCRFTHPSREVTLIDTSPTACSDLLDKCSKAQETLKIKPNTNLVF